MSFQTTNSTNTSAYQWASCILLTKGVWAFKHLCICAFEHWRICELEHLSICAFEHLCIWAFVRLCICAFEHLSIWAFVHLSNCEFKDLHCYCCYLLLSHSTRPDKFVSTPSTSLACCCCCCSASSSPSTTTSHFGIINKILVKHWQYTDLPARD